MEIIQKFRLGNSVPAIAAGALFFGNEQVYGKDNVVPTEIDYTLEPFTIESLEDGNEVTPISTYVQGNVFYYSTDKTNWTQCNMYSSSRPTITLDRGEKLYLKIDLYNSTQANKCLSNSDNASFIITSTKKYNACGNLMSLIYGNDFNGQTTTPNWAHNYGGLFRIFQLNANHGSYNDNIISARNLVFPEDNEMFVRMFWYCRNLIYAPKELKYNGSMDGTHGCTWGMFCYTPSLQETPLLYFTNYTSSNIYAMFNVENNSSLSNLKRVMLLKCTGGDGYGTNYWHFNPNGGYYYKDAGLSTSCYKPSNFTYRNFSYDFDDYCHIWAETDIPYAGYISGCSDYFVSGDTVTLQYFPLNNYTFTGWYDGDTLLSTSNPYTFTASSTKTLKARCTPPVLCTISAASNDDTMGTVTGGGSYWSGESATVTATANSGYQFVGWYESGSLVSPSRSYTFTVTGNRTLVATFEVATASYTEVSWITCNTNLWNRCYFDTLQSVSATSTFVARMKFIKTGTTGDKTFGSSGTSDSNDARLFLYTANSFYCDFGSGRFNASVNYDSTGNDWTWSANFSTKSYNVVNNKTSAQLGSSTWSTNPYTGTHFEICLMTIKFQGLTITIDGVDVFNGIPVLDNYNTPCIYDKVSGEFFYALGTDAGNITYEA